MVGCEEVTDDVVPCACMMLIGVSVTAVLVGNQKLSQITYIVQEWQCSEASLGTLRSHSRQLCTSLGMNTTS